MRLFPLREKRAEARLHQGAPGGLLYGGGPARVIPERYNTRYESAVFTGTASIVTDPAEKREKLDLLARRFFPGRPAQGRGRRKISARRLHL